MRCRGDDLVAGARACGAAEPSAGHRKSHNAVPSIMGHRTGPMIGPRREPAAADPAIWPVPRRGAELMRGRGQPSRP